MCTRLIICYSEHYLDRHCVQINCLFLEIGWALGCGTGQQVAPLDQSTQQVGNQPPTTSASNTKLPGCNHGSRQRPPSQQQQQGRRASIVVA